MLIKTGYPNLLHDCDFSLFLLQVDELLVCLVLMCDQDFLFYFSDLWNRLDLISLLVYLVTFILRLATFIMSGSAMNNRVLATAGYLYSLNTLFLTFRVFGHVLEQSKGVGTIQIALFSILKDISVVIWQFTAAILAFSIAITKVFMVEKSFIASASDDM